MTLVGHNIHPFSITTHAAFWATGPRHEINCTGFQPLDLIDQRHQNIVPCLVNPVIPTELHGSPHLSQSELVPQEFRWHMALARAVPQLLLWWGIFLLREQRYWGVTVPLGGDVRCQTASIWEPETRDFRIILNYNEMLSVLWLISLSELICFSEWE